MQDFSSSAASWRRGLGRYVLLAGLLATAPAFAQTGGVGIGTTTPNASAVLDLSSTSKGLLPPRLSQAQRDAIASPAAGLTVYNTTTGKVNTWNGTGWDAAISATEQPYQAASQTFTYTAPGGVQTYTVPTGVTSLSVDAKGASGGGGIFNNLGGLGARAQATLSVVPGQVLLIRVGGAGTFTNNGSSVGGGYNGGGSASYGGSGGGATDVRSSGGTLADRLLVAAGGGGSDYNGAGSQGGTGGAPTGGNGTDTNGTGGMLVVEATGATQTAGGLHAPNSNGQDGSLGQGGGGGTGGSGGGGGGGGYYGGGGGNAGGGGSSWVTPTGSSAPVFAANYQSGNGSVTLTPSVAYAAPALDGSNFVNVPDSWTEAGGNVYRPTGSVGIGTSAPATTLDVRAASAAITVGQPDNSGGALYFGNPNHGVKRFYGNTNDVGLYTTSANVYLSAAGLNTSQFVLRENGNVGIGYPANTPPAYKLDVNGSINASGQVRASGVVLTSDRRFKQNIRPLTSALAAVLALRGVRYDWNALGVQHGGTAGTEQVGLIAQELEKVYPELVSTDAQGYKAVNYAQLTPVLLEALKEQQAQIEALKAEAATAKAQVTQATATLETFEARLRRLEGAGGQAQR